MTTPRGRSAIQLARRGIRVFPVIERSKKPALKDWQNLATTDETKIEAWWQSINWNIGGATGPDSGVWVVDLDGIEGERTIRQLEAEHGALPPTVESITGAGRHLFFRWPNGETIRNTQYRDDMPGIDVRGTSGYVLCPPSIHPSGRVYAWSVDSANEFALAPDWLIARINRNGKPIEPRSPEYWRTFIGQDVDGSRRSAAIARYYGLLIRRCGRECAVDPILALDTVRLFNAMRCKPPLDDADVVRIANDIANREADRRGV